VIELLSIAETRAADRAAIAAGTPGRALMEAAGRAVAMTAVARFPAAWSVLVLCGPGANGGDGFVAARHLARACRSVRVALLGERAALAGDAAAAAADWDGPAEPIPGIVLGDARLVIDAVFGAGLSRDLPEEVARVLASARAAGVPILAVDVPSGLDGDTGAPRGRVTAADVTVTFARAKLGHVLLPGRTLCGDVVVADIGIPEIVIGAVGPKTYRNIPPLWRAALPPVAVDGHKYGRGHALVLSGPALATGAARLAALAAHRVGAGLVTIAGARDALAAHGAHVSAQMLAETASPADLAGRLADKRVTAVLAGPAAGVNDETRTLVETILAAGRATVLDADALTVFAGEAGALGARVHAGGGDVIMTPHGGEFARLFRGMSDMLEAPSKLVAARRAAAFLGAVLVSKGADTVVAAPDGRAAIAANAPPTLATAGSGDVLAGIATGLLARGMPAYEAACAAVWLHGEAAARLGQGLTADDLPGALPSVFAALR
jgi:NAD(P)H-hydrate epimerase